MSTPSIDNPLSLLKKKPESPVSAVLRQVEASLSADNARKAMEQCQQAITLSNNPPDIRDFALAQAYKAYVHGLLKQQGEGNKAAKQAIRCFHLSDEHNEAITYLIRALIHYKVGALEEAQSAYNTSRDSLERLYRRALAGGSIKQANEYYNALVKQISKRLEEIAQVIADEHMTTAEQRVPTTEQPAKPPDDQVSKDLISFLPVIGPIPAGQASISTDDIQLDVIATVDQVVIDETRYYIKRLRGRDTLIKLNRRQYGHYLSRVTGDSMNLAKPTRIDDGDYVVLRQSRDLPLSPDSGDIVAASIIDIDREATLKRYIKEGNTIILRPESSNSEHQPYEYELDKRDERVAIVGVAIAVLKPIE